MIRTKKEINFNKYHRQMTLPEMGISGQRKLAEAKVLIIGVGGLGCPILQYLAAAGVGSIGVVDGDVIEESNLHRQILYSKSDIGKYKVQQSELAVYDLNPECEVTSYKEMLTTSNVLDIISSYDIVIDGSDNYPTRYLVNDACVILNKVLIYGSVLQFEGQVGVFNLVDNTGLKTNYRDLFPTPPKASDVKSCSDAGVLGVLPGMIGTMQAAEAIKIITEIGEPLANKVLIYNMKTNFFYDFGVVQNPNIGKYPRNVSELYEYNYEWFCSGELKEDEVSIEKFEDLILSKETIIVDIRETKEQPKLKGFEYLVIPISEWENRVHETDSYKQLVLVCQSGVRSLKLLKHLKQLDASRKVFSLNGGVDLWVRTR